MGLTTKTMLIRGALVGVIGLSLPMKSWFEGLFIVGPAAQTILESTVKVGSSSSESQKSLADILPAAKGAAHASKVRYDLSRLELSYPTPAKSLANHSPSLASLGKGGLAMAWFGGSREGARDVRIFFARFDGDRWSEAQAIMGTDQLIAETGRYVTKLGNPMMYFDGERLHCWFVSVSLGGWGGARLNHMASLDRGLTWSSPKLLVSSPFLNVSTLVRGTALPTASNAYRKTTHSQDLSPVSRETLLPAYFELSHKYPVMLRVDSNSRIRDRYPFGDMTGLLQPSVVRTPWHPSAMPTPEPKSEASPDHAAAPGPSAPIVAFFRRSQAISQTKVFRSTSLDDGKTWTKAQALDVPNDDASVTAWAEPDETWLIANPDLGHRRSIASYRLPSFKALGGGASKPTESSIPSLVLDSVALSTPGHQEFSYPSFAKTEDGRLHLVYTADGRKTIRHRVWSPQVSTQGKDGK